MSNVRPLILLREEVTVPSALHCFGSTSSFRASARPLALPSVGSLSGPSFVIAANQRSVRQRMVFYRQSGAFSCWLKEQIQSSRVWLCRAWSK